MALTTGQKMFFQENGYLPFEQTKPVCAFSMAMHQI